MVQLLLNFRSDIEKERKQGAKETGLTETQYAFYNILLAELKSDKNIDEAKVKNVVQELVHMLDEATQIIGFFDKWDEQKRVRRDIKRIVIANFDESMVKPVSERFMELAKVKFG